MEGNMSFSKVLDILKSNPEGSVKVARRNWKNKDIFITFNKGETISVDGAAAMKAQSVFHDGPECLVGEVKVTYVPHLQENPKVNPFQPYNPSSIDIFAEDWYQVE